jgi:hypothetical protein
MNETRAPVALVENSSMAVTSDPTSRGYGATASPQVRISTSAAGTSATISCQVLLLHRSLSIGERRRLAYLRHGIRVLLGEEHNAAGGHDQHVAQHRGVRPFSCSRRRPSVCSGVGRSSARDNPRRPGRSRTRRERASGAAECCGAVRNLLFGGGGAVRAIDLRFVWRCRRFRRASICCWKFLVTKKIQEPYPRQQSGTIKCHSE